MDEKRRSNKRGALSDDNLLKKKPTKDFDSTVSNTPRKRVSQACDRCRTKKDKCDGGKPRCSTCASLDQVCSYDPATKKRGLPEGYVRGLEKLWGLSIREAIGIEETVLRMLGDGGDLDIEALLKVWNDHEGLDNLQETWRKSRLCQELERLLPLLESSDDKSVKRRRLEASQTRADSTNEPSHISSVRVIDSDFKFPFHGGSANDFTHTSADFPLLERRHINDTSEFVVAGVLSSNPMVPDLPQRAWNLLEVYFSYTHCWFPIIEKHDMLRTSYQYSTKPLKISCSFPGSGEHAALWAILTYAEHQNNTIKGGVQPQNVVDDWDVENLYSQARSLVPLEEGAFELGHIQALLLLGLLSMGKNQWDRAWLLVGQSVRIAVNLGLDESVRESKSAAKKSRSTHVFLGCFVLDTIIAAHLGRTPQLSKEDVKRAGSIEEDGSDEWNPWIDSLGVRRGNESAPRGPVGVISTFNRLIHLVEILNTIIRDVSAGTRRSEECQKLIDELNSWGQALPSQFASNSSKGPGSISLLPHQYHLHLAHIGIISALYGHVHSSAELLKVSEETLSDTFATAARQAMWLLLRQSESFGLLIVPPTYDYFVSIACEKVQGPVTDKYITHADWERNMQQYLEVMADAWPTFQGRKLVFSARASISQYQTPQSSITTGTHTSTPAHKASITTKRSSLDGSAFSFREGLPAAKRRPTENSNAVFTPVQYDLDLPSSSTLPNLSTGTPVWPDQTPAPPQFVPSTSADYLSFAHHGSIGSDIDGDSMFNEFATLDAMEWTNNWDQSLLNLGFTDPENMHSDFYTFAREPDPLYSTNLVQQLLSNNGETANLNQGPMMSGAGSGLRVNPAHFDDQTISFGHVRSDSGFSSSNPHVEASHILQALSGASEGQGKR